MTPASQRLTAAASDFRIKTTPSRDKEHQLKTRVYACANCRIPVLFLGTARPTGKPLSGRKRVGRVKDTSRPQTDGPTLDYCRQWSSRRWTTRSIHGPRRSTPYVTLLSCTASGYRRSSTCATVTWAATTAYRRRREAR